ncbi:50S ribosomal protein L24 [Candidatus Gastranaerophilus sp. (ex Termes propinquus)]|nr:50S ribosomal protein L24 [Candidatus Gastranaerophilus sp. (ex Termes propinquus)]
MAKENKTKQKVHVKVGDRVVVTSGRDRTKEGSVKEVFTKDGKVLVEGVNIVTKAQKPNPMAGIQGGLNKISKPMPSSKVMIVCPACEKATRIGHKIEGDKKIRICKKCNKELD